MVKPIVFEYEDYRKFLKAMYEYLKKTRHGFSYRSFSRSAGLKSPNFLKLVIDGQRNLSSDGIERFSRALHLANNEAEYFRNSVFLNQADSLDEKHYFADQVLGSKHFRKYHPVRSAQYTCYSRWYILAIRELIATHEFREDPHWIAKKIIPNITPSEAQSALNELMTLGMIKKDANNRLVQSDPFLSTEEEVPSLAVTEFHRQMIRHGVDSLERFPPESRDISAVTLGLSEKSAKTVKELIQKFRGELMSIAAQENAPTKVMQVNLQLFPLSEEKKGVV